MTAREKWIAYVTIVLKEIARFMRIWQQTLIPPAISTLLYFVIFGNLIGKRIGQMDGFDYMDFLVPGLILMAVINASYQNVVGSFFGAKWGKSIEELLVSPTPNSIILLAYITGGVARGMLVGLIVTGISLLFTDLNIFNLGILTGVVILTAVLFSLGGFVNAIFAKTFDDVSMIPTFVLLPLTYLGGVFYSIHLLSDFWQQVSKANPILYMVNAFRYGFLGISDVSLSLSFGMIGLFIISFFALSLYLLKYSRGLRA
ncbi:MAG TPA: ABC transporter permease [Verrucomicrobiota bacterium]|jgi:ABC-2 type transport system permease protein|nr:ABC transporter permease [Verrucomicrobiota bacterium]